MSYYASNMNAIIKDKEIRCPICNKKIGNISGNEVVKNFTMRCPRKLNGVAHEFIINIDMEVK